MELVSFIRLNTDVTIADAYSTVLSVFAIVILSVIGSLFAVRPQSDSRGRAKKDAKLT